MTSRRLPIVAVSLILLLAASCKREVRELPPPVPVETATVATALDTLKRNAASVRRYQGFVRIRGRGPDGGFSGRLVVVFERPHHLRVDLLGAFGSTRWTAVADDAGITVVFPGPKQYVEEEDVADIVGRLLGIRLDAEEVMALLAGVGTPLDGEPTEAFQQGPLTTATMTGGERVELSAEPQIERVQAVRYRVSYPTPWQERRRHVPDSIRLETETIQATLTPEDVDVNVPIDEEAFAVSIPEGAERLRPSDVAGEAVFVVTREPS